MATPFESLVRFVLVETVRHRFFVVIGFVLLTWAALYVGMNWPKIYTSSTSIYVEEQNIMGPLMQGAAVQTEVIDRSRIAREIIYGRKLLLKVLAETELDTNTKNPVELERMMEGIRQRTSVTGRPNLITIEYKDSDPELAYAITKQLADFFIAESLADKARESEAAFEFIDNQAQAYKEKLLQSEEELKRFRAENEEARPGIVSEIGQRNAALATQLDQISQELNEARIRRASLVKQLSGEAEMATNFSQAEQYKTRIAELQSQLDTLRLSYHETYPDIVHLKAQIADLRGAITREASRQSVNGQGRSGVTIDERVLANPVYQELQRTLYQTNTLIETLASRHENTKRALDEQMALGKRVQDYEARLAELTRDYEVNQEVYADLTRRRESARVSMNLDRAQKGLTMRIDEPPYMPHRPSGLQFIHFAIGGPVLGLLLSVGVVVVTRKLDPRIRSEERITEELGLPVLGVLPHMLVPVEARREAISSLALVLFLLAGMISMAVIIMQRIGGQG
jgi:polysaccharide chain length determinant protein (PEP-CTERM system associated)